jgi:RNA polymerase sigma-70 factor, ECF subfamily
VNASNAAVTTNTPGKLTEEAMEQKRPNHCTRQEGQECGANRVSSWQGGRCLMRRRRSIETRVPAPVAAFGDIGPGAEEAVLLTAARMGHPTAFGDLVERHAGRIQRVAFRITRNREDAEDAVQECLKNALMHLDSFRGQSQFSTWLTRIALNAALMKIRRRHRELRVDDSVDTLLALKWDHIPSPNPTPEQSYCRQELESILTDEIARLKQQFQEPVLLCHIKGLKTREAARVLGISDSAVKARLRRARLALRFRLERLGINKNVPANDRRVGSNFFRDTWGSPGLFAPTGRNIGFGV